MAVAVRARRDARGSGRRAGEPRASRRSARSSTPAPARWTSTCTPPRRPSSSATRRSSFLEVHVGHGAERLVLSPIVDHMVFDDDGRIVALARVLRSRRHHPRPGVSTPRRRLHPRSPRERAALAPVAHRGELGRATCSTRSPRARACSTSAAVRARSPSTSRSASRPAPVVGIDREPEVLDERARGRARGGRRQRRPSTSATCTRSRSPTTSFDVVHAHQVLQHLTDPVAALRGDAAGVRARRRGRRARLRLRARSRGSRTIPRLTRWLDAVPRGRAQQRRRARRRAAPAAVGARRGVLGRRRGARRRGASRPTPTATWWGGMWADRVVASAFAEQAVERGLRDAAPSSTT